MARNTPLTAALLALSLIASAPTAVTAQELRADDVTDAQVEAFVTAAIALEALRAVYMEKIAQAQTDEARAELREEADETAIGIVDKAKNITPDEYLAISRAAQEDEALAARVAAQIEVMRTRKAEFERQQADAARAKEAQKAEEALKAAEDTAKEETATE